VKSVAGSSQDGNNSLSKLGATKMTKEAKDKAHGEQSSQQTIHNPTKDHMDLTRGVEHKPTHQLFFILVFL